MVEERSGHGRRTEDTSGDLVFKISPRKIIPFFALLATLVSGISGVFGYISNRVIGPKQVDQKIQELEDTLTVKLEHHSDSVNILLTEINDNMRIMSRKFDAFTIDVCIRNQRNAFLSQQLNCRAYLP